MEPGVFVFSVFLEKDSAFTGTRRTANQFLFAGPKAEPKQDGQASNEGQNGHGAPENIRFQNNPPEGVFPSCDKRTKKIQ